MNNIQITVIPSYIESQSEPANNHYFFSYTVSITNKGSCAVQLINRHWKITDGDGLVQEVMGEGVVGTQPNIKPGENFQYSSGALLNTPFGIMQGHYQMLLDTGENIEVEIPSFQLTTHNTLH